MKSSTWTCPYCGRAATIYNDAEGEKVCDCLGFEQSQIIDKLKNEVALLNREKGQWEGNFIEWLANGRRGVSSNAIASRLSGINCSGEKDGFGNHPSDPADFLRCEKLLDAVPEFRNRLMEMADESPVWDALCCRWYEIKAVIERDLEETNGQRSPNGYALMKEVIKGAGI